LTFFLATPDAVRVRVLLDVSLVYGRKHNRRALVIDICEDGVKDEREERVLFGGVLCVKADHHVERRTVEMKLGRETEESAMSMADKERIFPCEVVIHFPNLENRSSSYRRKYTTTIAEGDRNGESFLPVFENAREHDNTVEFDLVNRQILPT
jgi:hypothetical protein